MTIKTRLLVTSVLVLGAALVSAAPAYATHPGDVDCGDFTYQEDAQAHLDAHPGDPDDLDSDGDGIACERLPHRPGGGGPAPVPTVCPSPSATPSPTRSPASPSPEPTPSPDPTPSPSESPDEEQPPPASIRKAPVAPPVVAPPVVVPPGDVPVDVSPPSVDPSVEPSVDPSAPDAPGGGGALPCVSESPEAPGSAGDDDLPVTGASLGGGIAAGLSLLLTGGFAVLLSRRRRQQV